MSVLGLLLLVGGAAHLLNAGASGVLGRDFSYYPQYVGREYLSRPASPPLKTAAEGEATPLPAIEELTPEEEEALREEGLQRAFEEGLLRGISYGAIGAIIWAAHVWGRGRVETPEERRGDLLGRLYLLGLLLVFGIVTVSSLPSATFETLRYYILDDDLRQTPGGELSTALAALPVWLLYLKGTIQSRSSQVGRWTYWRLAPPRPWHGHEASIPCAGPFHSSHS